MLNSQRLAYAIVCQQLPRATRRGRGTAFDWYQRCCDLGFVDPQSRRCRCSSDGHFGQPSLWEKVQDNDWDGPTAETLRLDRRFSRSLSLNHKCCLTDCSRLKCCNPVFCPELNITHICYAVLLITTLFKQVTATSLWVTWQTEPLKNNTAELLRATGDTSKIAIPLNNTRACVRWNPYRFKTGNFTCGNSFFPNVGCANAAAVNHQTFNEQHHYVWFVCRTHNRPLTSVRSNRPWFVFPGELRLAVNPCGKYTADLRANCMVYCFGFACPRIAWRNKKKNDILISAKSDVFLVTSQPNFRYENVNNATQRLI